jgi:hypothetical protein
MIINSGKVNHTLNLSLQWQKPFEDSDCPPNILLMGDSVDRQVVEEFCGSQNVQDWSNKLFGYKKDTLGAALCKKSEGSMGQLHFFGSNASGPYLHNYRNTPKEPFADTKARLCKGIEVYSRNVGVPTLIVFQIMLWDITVFKKIRIAVEVKAQRYRENMIARVKDLQSCKNLSSTIMLRTVPAMLWGGSTNVVFNNVLRNLSREMGIGMVDYDAMVWGADRNFSRQPTLFRDATHPSKRFSAKLAARLLSIGNDVCNRSAYAASADETPAWTS